MKDVTLRSDDEVKAWGQNFAYRLWALMLGLTALFHGRGIGLVVGWVRENNPMAQVSMWILFDEWMFYAVAAGLLAVVVVGIPRRKNWEGRVKRVFWGLVAVAALLLAQRVMFPGGM